MHLDYCHHISTELTGAKWIRTANTPKTAMNNPLVSSSINQQAVVFVGVAPRVSKLPWMDARWVDAGTSLKNSEVTPKTFELFKKTFLADILLLGPNNRSTDVYTVVVP